MILALVFIACTFIAGFMSDKPIAPDCSCKGKIHSCGVRY